MHTDLAAPAAAAPGTAPWRPSVAVGVAVVLLAGFAALAPAAGPSVGRLVVGACLVGLVVVQYTVDWRALVVALAAWLVLLGLVRRLLNEVTVRPNADPLLIVAPVALGLLTVAAIRSGGLTRRSTLTTGVLALDVLTLLESANLSQVPLVASIAALLFVLVPQLAFWVGRALPDATLRALLRVIAGLALGAAAYGLLQTYVGFFPWDRNWADQSATRYSALNVSGTIRAFGTSASAAEYAYLLAIGIVCWLVVRPASRLATGAAVAVLVAALVLESSRGPVVVLVAALVLVAAARYGVRGGTALVLTALIAILVPLVASFLVPHTDATSDTSRLLAHQAEGLANPFDPRTSTLLGHLSLVGTGLASAVHHPFGLGVGVITIATKFGGSYTQSEADVSNVAMAFGLVGVVIFLVVFCLALSRAYRTARLTRSPLALATLGILIVTTNQWLNGGMYAVAWLPWLVLGWLDRTAGINPGEEDT